MPRRRDRVAYPPTTSALGNPTSAEKLAMGVAAIAVGELTSRDKVIAVEIAHFFSGAIADLEAENQRLAELVLELRRITDG